MLRALAFLFLFLLAGPVWADVSVKDVRLGTPEPGQVRFVLELDQPADYHLFLLDNPTRAVLDLPTLSWPQSLAPSGRGLVKGWRSGQFGHGTRVVLDLTGPAKVVAMQAIPAREGKGPRLVLDLAENTQADFTAKLKMSWGGRAQEALQQAALGVDLPLHPPPLPQLRRSLTLKPLVAIDAGHGGVDPGAIAVNGTYEKVITLAVAKQLEEALLQTGKYRTMLTRKRDVFVPLQERVRLAREAGADLFISLHADSIKGTETRGATVYTLSDLASDKQAAALAESENRADELAGLSAARGDDTLADILTNMSFRASLNGGRNLSQLLISSLRSESIRLTERPERSAGFAVLKAPDIPSVLIEMGYVTSRQDADLLTQPQHQQRLASAVAGAVDDYFLRHRPSEAAEAIAVLGQDRPN